MEGDFDEGTCAGLLETLARRRLPSIELGLEAERALFHDLVQRVYSDDGAGDGYLLPHALGGLPFDVIGGDEDGGLFAGYSARFFFAGRRETLLEFDRLVDGLIDESRLLPVDRWQGPFDPVAIADGAGRRNFMVGLMAPAFQTTVRNDAVVQVRSEGTRVMVALALHRARHGAYPSSLSALAPEILPEAPVDPLHGLPFVYRLLEDDPHGRPYLLYSTGYDRTDDGGRPSEVRGEPFTAGSDHVINKPRSGD
jgi:hypothetical protein